MMSSLVMSILLVAMVTSFLVIFYAEYRRGSLFILYTLGLVILMMPALSYDLWTAISTPSSPRIDMMIRVAVYVTAFNFLYGLFREVSSVVYFPKQLKPVQWANPAHDDLTIKILWCLPPFILFLTFASYGFSLDNMMSSSWVDAHGDEGRLANVLKDLMLFITPGAVTYLVIQKRTRMAVLYGIVLMILIIMDRTRGALVGLFANIAFLMFVHYRNSPHKGRLLIWYALVGVLTVFMFVGIQLIRYAGAFSNLIGYLSSDTILPLIEKRLMSRDSEIHIIDYFYYVIGHERYITGEGNYSNLMRTLFVWDLTHTFKGSEDMPKELWEAFKLADLKPRQGSLHPTIYGISWLDGYWGGLIYAPFLACFFSALEWVVYRLSKIHPCWYFALGSLGYVSAFSARGSLYMAMWNCAVGIVFCLIVLMIMKWALKKYSPPNSKIPARHTSITKGITE